MQVLPRCVATAVSMDWQKNIFFSQIIEKPLKTNRRTKKSKKLMASAKQSLELG
jgi:hypothetical protein